MAEFDETAAPAAIDVRSFADARQEMAELGRLGRQFSNTMVGAFEGIAIKGKGLNDVLRSLAVSLSQLVLKAALRPLGDAFGGFLQSLFASGTGFAKGGVLRQSMPVPFAGGGVIQSPVSFPLAGGRVGLAGESGPEAILPLARGPDGRLGVTAQTGGATNIVFNVTTPDADSFVRSQSQVAAMVARAVAMGQRNL